MQYVVGMCLLKWVCTIYFSSLSVFLAYVFVKRGGVEIIWACRCATVSFFVSVMDSQKMREKMEAENPVACCLVQKARKEKGKKRNLGCHSSRPRGTGVHIRCRGVNTLLIRSEGGCRAAWWDSDKNKSLVSTWLCLGLYGLFEGKKIYIMLRGYLWCNS